MKNKEQKKLKIENKNHKIKRKNSKIENNELFFII